MNDRLVMLRAALSGWQSGIWTALPAIVESFDATKLTVSAQLAIQAQVRQPSGGWQNVNITLCEDCPVIFMGGGAFLFTAPLVQGDEGLLILSSRCIDAWWQNGGVQPQAELRMHDLSDGFFIPLCFSQPKVPPNVSTTSAQFRTRDGAAYVELAPGHVINIVAPGGLNINAPVVFNGSITDSGKNVGATHVHSGVQPGGGDSGPPV